MWRPAIDAATGAAFIRAVDAYRAKMQQLQQQQARLAMLSVQNPLEQLPQSAFIACRLSLLVFRTFIEVG